MTAPSVSLSVMRVPLAPMEITRCIRLTLSEAASRCQGENTIIIFMGWPSQRMIKTILKYPLLQCLCLIAFTQYSIASENNESNIQPEVDWELIIPQEILQATVCKWELTEEERLFFENSYY